MHIIALQGVSTKSGQGYPLEEALNTRQPEPDAQSSLMVPSFLLTGPQNAQQITVEYGTKQTPSQSVGRLLEGRSIAQRDLRKTSYYGNRYRPP